MRRSLRCCWSRAARVQCRDVAMFALMGIFSAPGQAISQVNWQDLVFTGGLSIEGYRGNLAAVTVPAVDSTERASAIVGEMGVRGGLSLFARRGRSLTIQMDAGLRQFSAGGFEVRDYAPREWVGKADLTYRQALSSVGVLRIETRFDARRVDDRPPMPLFIQPGYVFFEGSARTLFNSWRGLAFDVAVDGEIADYQTSGLTPQLDLLDRKVLGLEVGSTWGAERTLRLHGSVRLAEYANQGTFDPDDPFRRDKSLTLGITGTFPHPSGTYAQVSLEGIINRSNSDRPEYNALRFSAVLAAPLPGGVSLNLLGAFTTKDYRADPGFARLVPGEEADNASQLFLELARPLLLNLDGAVRFGWTRAETDFGDSYFRRYGGSLLLRYRPWAR